ncbi:MAG: matrixin family metalloprotease [Phormidesmis sp.]
MSMPNPADSFSQQLLALLEIDALTLLADTLTDIDPNLSEEALTNALLEIVGDAAAEAGVSLDDLTGDLSTTDLLDAFGIGKSVETLTDFSLGSAISGFSLQNSFLETLLPKIEAIAPFIAPLNGTKPLENIAAALPEVFPKTFMPETFIPETFFVPEDAAAFTTVAANGQRSKNGVTNGTPQLKWDSVPKADGSSKTLINFAFQDSFQLSGIETARAKTLFSKALGTWASYAPIDFQEIKDPQSTTLFDPAVDIFVQSDDIDGAGKTLAFAYFPSVGDVTFDTGESWSDLLFLETAVHEVGHSLGLDHEDDKPAVMNSVLAAQYTDVNKPFLKQDDINGIRSLYGNGVGSVTTLNGQVELSKMEADAIAPAADKSITSLMPNLVVNGSFEKSPVKAGEFGFYKRIQGWTTMSGIGFRVDKRTEAIGPAADGDAWVSLDIYNSNATIGQNVDTVTGQSYTLAVDYATGGAAPDTAGIDIFWNAVKVGSLTPDSLTEGGLGWQRFRYEVVGGNPDMSTLAFRATGTGDSIGGLIDNVSVTANIRSLALSDSSSEASLGASGQATAGLVPSRFGADPDLLLAGDFTSPLHTETVSFI